MSLDLIKFAFVAGEVSPSFYGRPDLEKFDLALAEGENWFVDYRGGVSTRPGTEFLDYIKDDDKPIKLVDFKFSSSLANTNVLILGHQYIRFVQDGAYVLEASKAITDVTQANPGVVTATAHGFSNGDWVKIADVVGMTELNGETFVVAGAAANTFQLKDTFGNNVNTTGFGAYVSDGTVARIYTVASPWDSAHLADLRFHQIRDTLRFTHKNYKIRNLKRLAANNWAISIEDFANPVSIPTGISHSVIATGTNGVVFAVTAINEDGQESLPSDYYIIDNTNDYTSTNGGVSLKWTPVTSAKYYNVYRSRITDKESAGRSMPLGFVARTTGAFFTDKNITPDFTRTPPQENDPFADRKITHVDVTAGGSGYNQASTFAVTDAGGGTGFVGFLIVGVMNGGTTGPVLGVLIRSAGKDYVTPVASLGGVGTGATFSFTIGPASGNNPAVGTIFQQREVYGSTENKPLTVFGSRPAKLSDFGVSDILIASDSYEHEIDSDSVDPIRHLIPIRGGLIVINESGIWLLSGPNNQAVTAINAQADAQAFQGATNLVPLRIDTDVLYAEGQGGSIQLLSYNDINKVYSGADMSVLANHLFGKGQQVQAWAYAGEPFKLVWAQREDGMALTFTILKDQQVYAWMRHTTKGLFMDMIAVQENQRSSVYTVVKRYINGRWTKFLERVAERTLPHVEDAWSVDCGLRLSETYPAATIQIDTATGNNVLVTASVATFSSGDVGKILRAGGGKMEVIAYNTNTTIHVNIIRAITDIVPQTNPALPRPFDAGEWTLDMPRTVIGGLKHLEGQVVQVLADGNVLASKTVTNGKITLEQEATRVVVGLSYRALLKTLPITLQGAVLEDKRKRIVGIAARVHEARGLKYGSFLDHLYEGKERTNEPWGEPTELQEGMSYILIEPDWNEEGQVYIVQDYPLPATVLGFVLNAEIGDDDDSRAAD